MALVGNRNSLLAGRVQILPILVLCCCRPLPRSRELERLIETFSAYGAHHLVLGPFDQAAVSQLLEDQVGSSKHSRARSQCRRSEGLPSAAGVFSNRMSR